MNKILVLFKNPDIRDLTRIVLDRYPVISVDNVDDAMVLLESKTIDLLIMHYRFFDEQSSYASYEIVRANSSLDGIGVILYWTLSGKIQDINHRDGVIQDGFGREQLIQTVEKVLQNYGKNLTNSTAIFKATQRAVGTGL